jgi:hypothetical protein
MLLNRKSSGWGLAAEAEALANHEASFATQDEIEEVQSIQGLNVAIS